jgi:polyhydroxybutyrate depolymerase
MAWGASALRFGIRTLLALAVTGLVAAACGAVAPGTQAPTASAAAAPTQSPAATATISTSTTPSAPAGDPTRDRPYDVLVPTTYKASVPMPLVMLLHGFSLSSAQMEAIFPLQPVAEERGFLYVHPDGTKNPDGDPFWNATDACCNEYDEPVDDSAYLGAVIEQVQTTYNVDPKRIYLFGVSNGGFMSYRMACDHADKIAAIVSFAGATWLDAARCKPSQPVSVLEIHGTADEIIPFDGGQLIDGHPFPSAATTVAEWATYNGCGPNRAPTGLRLDLGSALPGDETDVSRFDGCPAGGTVELWTVEGGTHMLPFTSVFTPSVVEFLFAHPKP